MNDRAKSWLSFGSHQQQNWDIEGVVRELRNARLDWRKTHGRTRELGGREFPSREALHDIVEALCGVLFPMRLGPPDLNESSEDFYVGHTLAQALDALVKQLQLELSYSARLQGLSDAKSEQNAVIIARGLAAELPRLRRILDADVHAAYVGDPAARSVDEVLLCYPRHQRHPLPPPGALPVPRRCHAGGTHHRRDRALRHRHRHPPRRPDRQGLFHRPRHRCGDR